MSKSKYITHLVYLRDKWSDTIPREIVDSKSGVKTKARTAWFTEVARCVETALMRGHLPDEMEGEHAAFLATIRNFNGSRLTTPQDIQYGNRFLNYALSRLNMA